jgi:glucose 1-dehydrogenase
MRLQNKIAVITGAANGIGAATAVRFAAEGAKVVVSDRDPKAGDAVVAAIKASGGEARFQACDVTDRAQVAALMECALDAYGSLDVVCANAGIIHSTPFLDLDDETWRRVLDVNLTGVFYTGQEGARRMVARGIKGAIVNTASVNAVIVPHKLAAYNASKGGVNQLTKTMAMDLAQYGIRVNAVGPGSVATDMFRSAMLQDPEGAERMRLRTPMERAAEPEEIAAAILFLASDDASYFTGQTIYPDGGRSAMAQIVPKRA